jgi:hypothetical protein
LKLDREAAVFSLDCFAPAAQSLAMTGWVNKAKVFERVDERKPHCENSSPRKLGQDLIAFTT